MSTTLPRTAGVLLHPSSLPGPYGIGDVGPIAYEWVEVLAAADELDERGFVVDFKELDLVKDWVDATLDHRHLNDVMEGQPSAEAIARLICDWCRASLPAPVAEKIVAVRAWETPKAYAEYRP